MTQEEFDNHPAWKDANYEGAERTMLQNGMRMTLIEKLRWLEETETFSLHFPLTAAVLSPRADSRWRTRLGRLCGFLGLEVTHPRASAREPVPQPR